jgi:hypothetical protein
MAAANAAAVLAGLFGHVTEFVRTPKYGLSSRRDILRVKRYSAPAHPPIIEMALCIYFVYCGVLAIHWGRFLALPFNALFTIGCFYVVYSVARAAVGPSPRKKHPPTESIAKHPQAQTRPETSRGRVFGLKKGG